MPLMFTLEDFLTLDCDIREYIVNLLFQMKKETLWKDRLFVAYNQVNAIPYIRGTVTEDIFGTNQHILRDTISIGYRWWNGKINRAHNTYSSSYVWADDNRWRPYKVDHNNKKNNGMGPLIVYLDE